MERLVAFVVGFMAAVIIMTAWQIAFLMGGG